MSGSFTLRSRAGLVCGALATLAGCAWIDAKQRERVYRPTPGRPADFAGLRADDRMVTLAVPGASATQTDRLRPWWLPNPNPQAPTLLHLHGTFRNPFRNHRKIDAPIRMMHGSADRPVPFALGRGLFEAAPPGAHRVPFQGGSHSDLAIEQPERYREALRQSIGRLPVRATP